jgi:hypothetical protein
MIIGIATNSVHKPVEFQTRITPALSKTVSLAIILFFHRLTSKQPVGIFLVNRMLAGSET